MRRFISQSFCLPTPTITEDNCPDQSGRVFIVTGGYAGCGKELSKILYQHNAVIYIAGRSQSKAHAAIDSIKGSLPNSKGRLEFMDIDLSNLATIKPGVDRFLSKEQRLDVLVNNAGVMVPPEGSVDSHGTELQIGTNCVGPYLLHKLLQPILTRTAATGPAGSVRVAWAGSLGVDVHSPKPGGMVLDDTGRPTVTVQTTNYGASKVGNLFFANRYARDTPKTGVVHVCFNPGNLKTELQRNVDRVTMIMTNFMLYPAVYGGYTELFAAVSPEVTAEKSGAYIHPWGRFGGFRDDIAPSMKAKSEGGTGVADKFIAWCEAQTKPFA